MTPLIFYTALISSQFHIDLDPKQTECIATAVYSESRGEPIMGMASVAYVINNRVHDNRYPDTACEVVYQQHQFTDIKLTKPDFTSKSWKRAVEIAAFTQVGLIDDETDGATMYHNPDTSNPRWDFSKLELVGNLKNHRFYIER